MELRDLPLRLGVGWQRVEVLELLLNVLHLPLCRWMRRAHPLGLLVRGCWKAAVTIARLSFVERWLCGMRPLLRRLRRRHEAHPRLLRLLLLLRHRARRAHVMRPLDRVDMLRLLGRRRLRHAWMVEWAVRLMLLHRLSRVAHCLARMGLLLL